jgi:hypothetical protein
VEVQTLLLDCSAINWIFGGQAPKSWPVGQADRLQVSLAASVEARTLRLLLTEPLMYEIFSSQKPGAFDLMATRLWTLGGRYFLAPQIHRIKCELAQQSKGPPPLDHVCELQRHCKHLKRICFSSGFGEKARSHAIGQKAEWQDNVKDFFKVHPVTPGNREAVLKDWRDKRALVNDWTESWVMRHPRRLCLPTSRAKWPADLAKIPTLWRERAYTAARAIEVHAEGRAPERGDLYDMHYFRDAAYADVLVTADNGMVRIAETIAELMPPTPRVVHINDWAGEVLAAQ